MQPCRRPSSCRAAIASRTSRAERSAIGGSGPSCTIRRDSAWRSSAGSTPRADRELGGHEHAVRDRLAVAEAAVLRDRLERMARRVAEVQHAARAGFALVLSTTTAALMRHDSPMTGTSTPGSRAKIAVRFAFEPIEQRRGSTSCRT